MRKRLREKLSTTLPTEELKQVYDSFDIIGDIAIFKMSKGNTASAETVANKIMAVHRNVKTVFIQTSPIFGDFRVRTLKLSAGEDKTSTQYKRQAASSRLMLRNAIFLQGFYMRGTGLLV